MSSRVTTVGRRVVLTRAGLVAALLVPGVVVALSTTSSGGDPSVWWLVLADTVVLGAAATTASTASTRPVLALCFPLGLAVVQWALLPAIVGTDPTIILGVAVFAGLAGRRAADTTPALRAAAGASIAALVLTIGREMLARSWFGVISGLSDALVIVLALLGCVIVPWLIGRYLRQRAALITAGWEQARLLERHRGTELDQARVSERARIAQEMHDSLGHQLSLVALRASVLELTAASDDAVQAAAEIRTGVAEANAQLHTVISVLRPPAQHRLTDPDLEDDPDLDPDVNRLVSRAAAAGLDVRLERDEPPESEAPAPVAVRRTVYLLVQEGLTNVAKHAHGGAARVAITVRAGTTAVTVDSASARAAPSAVGSGLGLVGLRERVRLLGRHARRWAAGRRLPAECGPAPRPADTRRGRGRGHRGRRTRGRAAADPPGLERPPGESSARTAADGHGLVDAHGDHRGGGADRAAGGGSGQQSRRGGVRRRRAGSGPIGAAGAAPAE